MGADRSTSRPPRRSPKQSEEPLSRLAALDRENALTIAPDLSAMADADLIRLRAALDVEMKRRNLAVTVGQIAEQICDRLLQRDSRTSQSPAGADGNHERRCAVAPRRAILHQGCAERQEDWNDLSGFGRSREAAL